MKKRILFTLNTMLLLLCSYIEAAKAHITPDPEMMRQAAMYMLFSLLFLAGIGAIIVWALIDIYRGMRRGG